MPRRFRHLFVPGLALFLAFAAPPARAQEEDGSEPEVVAGPATHVASRGPFLVAITLEGVFEAAETSPIAVRTEEWTELEVATCAAHGQRVEAGDVVLAFETEAFEEALAEAAAAVAAAELERRGLAEELRHLQATAALDLDGYERASQVAGEDLARFLEVEKALEERRAAEELKDAEESLRYEQEELDQLRKMYEADELTEETEEIILQRQRNAVASYQFALEATRISVETALKFELPRRELDLRATAERAARDLETQRLQIPHAIEAKAAEIEAKDRELAAAKEKLARLDSDRAHLVVAAPRAGIVYHGEAVRGQWPEAAGLVETLRPGGAVTAGAVVLTIVSPRPIWFRADVAEANLHWLRAGAKGYAVPGGLPRVRVGATLESVSAIPIGPGAFEARVALEPAESETGLVPGMTGQVRFVVCRKDDALTIPLEALGQDEFEENREFVWILRSDGTNEKRPVRIGSWNDSAVEILEGLAEGETLVLGPGSPAPSPEGEEDRE